MDPRGWGGSVGTVGEEGEVQKRSVFASPPPPPVGARGASSSVLKACLEG